MSDMQVAVVLISLVVFLIVSVVTDPDEWPARDQ